MPFRDEEEDQDDLYDHVAAMADRMQLSGKEREAYIDDHMIQGGYQRVQARESYARVQQEEDAAPEDEGRPSSRWFGGGSRTQAPGRGAPRPRPVRSQQRGAEDDRY